MQVVNHQQRDTVRQALIGLGGGLLLAFLAFGNAHAGERRTEADAALASYRKTASVIDADAQSDPSLEMALAQLRDAMVRESRTARASLPEHKQRY